MTDPKPRTVGHKCHFCERYGMAGFELVENGDAYVWRCSNHEGCAKRYAKLVGMA